MPRTLVHSQYLRSVRLWTAALRRVAGLICQLARRSSVVWAGVANWLAVPVVSMSLAAFFALCASEAPTDQSPMR
ncbi:hypothetical protein D9M69_689300 [compost metagenome]